MTAFADAIDVLFGDPNMAVDGFWRAGGCAVAQGVAVRVIRAAPDAEVSFGAARVFSGAPSLRLEVRVSEVARVAKGDLVDIGGETFLCLGDGRGDDLGLVWRVEAGRT